MHRRALLLKSWQQPQPALQRERENEFTCQQRMCRSRRDWRTNDIGKWKRISKSKSRQEKVKGEKKAARFQALLPRVWKTPTSLQLCRIHSTSLSSPGFTCLRRTSKRSTCSPQRNWCGGRLVKDEQRRRQQVPETTGKLTHLLLLFLSSDAI